MIQHLPNIFYSQAKVLALWSFGMLVARSCGLTSVANQLATLTGQKETALRQCLREWCWCLGVTFPGTGIATQTVLLTLRPCR